MKFILALMLYPGLLPVCVRYVDDEGYLRGRQVTFNTNGRNMALDKLPLSLDGACPAGLQGLTQRVTVCLVASSKCHHDRTTNVWGDQIEWYFDRYPESHRGKCTSECSAHLDDCGSKVSAGISDWYQWRRWMRELDCQRKINGC